MRPTDIDQCVEAIREANEAAFVKITIVWENGDSVNHENGKRPRDEIIDFGERKLRLKQRG